VIDEAAIEGDGERRSSSSGLGLCSVESMPSSLIQAVDRRDPILLVTLGDATQRYRTFREQHGANTCKMSVQFFAGLVLHEQKSVTKQNRFGITKNDIRSSDIHRLDLTSLALYMCTPIPL
jgi:hypothetical protein